MNFFFFIKKANKNLMNRKPMNYFVDNNLINQITTIKMGKIIGKLPIMTFVSNTLWENVLLPRRFLNYTFHGHLNLYVRVCLIIIHTPIFTVYSWFHYTVRYRTNTLPECRYHIFLLFFDYGDREHSLSLQSPL